MDVVSNLQEKGGTDDILSPWGDFCQYGFEGVEDEKERVAFVRDERMCVCVDSLIFGSCLQVFLK